MVGLKFQRLGWPNAVPCRTRFPSCRTCIKAFSETDQTDDLKKFDVPTLVMHGEDDQIVPIKDSAKRAARLIKGSQELYYPGAPHGLTATYADWVNSHLLEFLQQGHVTARKAA